jgi:frataxin-like iron-binding protein CyaY
VRRRRGGGDGVSPDAGEGRAGPHVAVEDPNVFRHEADKLLVKIESALRPMEKFNEVFTITLIPRNHYQSGSLTLELAPDEGTYSLEVNDEAMRVVFQSALSGHYNYMLSASTGEWVDEKDGHSFVGMLVRDLIRQCNGLPDL